MAYQPLISANILSFNRRDELRNTITKVYAQNYKNIELIVVDNASTDGSSEMVEKEFPEVKVIRLEKNIGIAGWNEGLKIANGEYILVLDDDAYPEENAINLSVSKLEANSEIGCIGFNILNTNEKNEEFRSHWLPNKEVKECEWPIFIGCAAMFRKSLNLRMPDDYFLYQHELPVAADIYLRDHNIFYNSKIIAYHFFKDQYTFQNEIYFLKNNIKFIIKYIPYPFIFYYLLKLILFFFLKSILKGWFEEYMKIIKNINFSTIRSKRIPFFYFWKIRKIELFDVKIHKRLSN